MALPHFPFYPGDFIRDTMNLSAEQIGVYMLLLMSQWQTGSLPDDQEQLARIARVESERWPSVGSLVLPYFDRVRGRLVQKRLDRERKKAEAKIQVRKIAGKKGGMAKAIGLKRKSPLANAKQKQEQTGSGSYSYPLTQEMVRESSLTLDMKWQIFWHHYPRKEGMRGAHQEFHQALLVAKFSEIMTGVANLIDKGDPVRFVPLAEKWLRGCRWTDEPAIDVKRKKGSVWQQIATEIQQDMEDSNGADSKVIDLSAKRG